MALTNKEIYKRTIGFSIRRLLWDFLAFAILAACAVLGFIFAEAITNAGLVGLAIGAVIGIIIIAIMLRYVSYTYKAGQIAMMTKAVSEGKLPDDVIGAGKKIVKERFATVAVYFAATNAIKGIFNQIGRGITSIGEAVGGDTGGAIGSTISAVIQTIVDYLCDCCLGWVFYRKDQKAFKATCEGAVIFFKKGKTLLKNLGRIFGMGLVSFILIGGVFTGIFWLIFQAFPDAFANLANEVAQIGSDVPAWLTEPATFTLTCAIVSGILIWSFIHSAFIRPFVLVGVLRNFIEAGKTDIPSEKSFDELDKKSAKFKKLHAKMDEQ